MAYFLRFLYSQLFVRVPEPTSDFSGQTIVVTGSNTGLGREAAHIIVRLGASKVILAVRSLEKGNAAAADILKSLPASKAEIDVWTLDLADHASIKAFADKANTLPRLDAVIQNAAVYSHRFESIGDDERHVAINVVGATLVGLQLLPKLRETAKKLGVTTRLCFVGSDTMFFAQRGALPKSGSLLGVLNRPETLAGDARYPMSKLLLYYAVREIASRSPLSEDSNVVISCLTPGLCKSDLFREDMPWFQKTAMSLLSRTTQAGANAIVDGIRSDLGKEEQGTFLLDCKVTDPGANVDSEEGRQLQQRFTDELFPKLERLAPGIMNPLK